MKYARFLGSTIVLFVLAGIAINAARNLLRGSFTNLTLSNWSLAISITLVGVLVTVSALIFFAVQATIRKK